MSCISGYIKIMMKQHIGVPATPLVNVGDTVKKGQLIAMCNGLGANIHSSVFGVIAEANKTAITISADNFQSDEYVKIKSTASNLEAVKEAGIVGAGGAGFPAHAKFDVDLQGGCIILNAAECEPSLFHNMRVLSEDAEKIISGIKYIMGMTNSAKSYIAIKPKNKAEMIAIAKACKNEANIEIKFLRDIYPTGDERVVIREVLGMELKPGQLPTAVGAVVTNVETVKRVTEAIELRKPVITKDFTVGGRLADTLGRNPRVYLDQPIGTPVKKYLKDCGGFIEPHGEVVLGGPFMGRRSEDSSTITKTLSGIFAAMPFPNDSRNFGILACECGAEEERLREIVAGMGGRVICAAKCKRMVEADGRFRCDKPGCCPGQAGTVLWLKSKGAEAILAGSCED